MIKVIIIFFRKISVTSMGPSCQCSLQSLTSKLHISCDSVACSVCSLQDWLGVPAEFTIRWVQLPPTSLPFPPQASYILVFASITEQLFQSSLFGHTTCFLLLVLNEFLNICLEVPWLLLDACDIAQATCSFNPRTIGFKLICFDVKLYGWNF